MAQTLTVSQILADLQSGLTRAEIGEKYGLNGVQVKALFNNPKLKNKKTIKVKGAAFVLVDDTEDAIPAPEVVQETASVVNDTVIPPVVEEVVNTPEPEVAEEATVFANTFEDNEEIIIEDDDAPEVEQGDGPVWGV